MPAVTTKFLEPYVQSNKVRHKYFEKSCELAEAIDIHASGKFPDDLIKERRPAETKQIKDYREKIYVAKTKPVFQKVYNALQKINRSPDFALLFPEETPARIADDETLKAYIERAIPQYGSVVSWFWSVAFRYYLIDANGVILTLPKSYDEASNEYYKPLPMIITSEAIIDYKEGEYYLFITSSTERYEDEQQTTYMDGVRYMLIQPDVIQVFEYLPRTQTITEIAQYPNEIGYIPVRSLRGLCVDSNDGYNLYESRISGIIPMLDEAVREYSDLQAEIVQHIHSTMWTLQPQQCTDCKGRGSVPVADGAPIPCKTCNGKGIAPLNPYEHLTIPLPRAGESPLPTPYMGYVEKNTEIARLQDERIRQHIFEALASINMEYLADVPLSQSGTAKQVDREELYSFVHSVAVDCCRIIKEVITDMAYWRYKSAGFADDVINDMLPTVAVPERFDLLNGSVLVEEITKMTTGKVDPAIINAAQVDLAEKRFATNPHVRDMVKLKLLLDPFAGVPEENISLLKTFGAISQIDLVIHGNINEFINRALQEQPNFGLMTMQEQRAVMIGYANEKMTQMQPVRIDAQPAEDTDQ